MNELKKMTTHDYTKWDLNCPYVHIYNKTEMKKKITRKARRQNESEKECHDF